MRIDNSHRKWAVASFSIVVVGAVAYIPYALSYPGGPRGNSFPGLVYGIFGYLMMLYAGLMGARKKVPLWRIGRASVWMRGHLWMGALSLPMILWHSAFTARGPLTFVMMMLLVFVVASGIAGALIQHFTPKMITEAVPMETIYEQIPHVREQLREEADAIIARLCREPEHAVASAQMDTGRIAVAEDEAEPEIDSADRQRLRNVYTHGILPFLRDPDDAVSPLASAVKATPYFEALRRQAPVSIHESLTDIEHICEEQRQLTRQRRMYVWMHAWLLVHVPVSVTLLVLGFIHALIAIRY